MKWSVDLTRSKKVRALLVVLLGATTPPGLSQAAGAESGTDATTLQKLHDARGRGDRASAGALANEYLRSREARQPLEQAAEPLDVQAVRAWYEGEVADQRQVSRSDAVLWRLVKADFKRQYPSLAKQFTPTVELVFRADIEGALREALGQGVSWDDWTALKKGLASRFPGYDAEGIYRMKRAMTHTDRKQWSEACEDVGRMFRVDGKRVIWRTTNTNTLVYLAVFQHCEDKGTLRLSARWMERLVAANPKDVNAIDTLASVLYKLGRTADALLWEQRALDRKPSDTRLAATLEAMKAGLPTWEEPAR